RVDDEIKLKNISEQGLGDRLYIGPLEIHLDAVALHKCGLLQRGSPQLWIAIARPFWLHVRARKQERLICRFARFARFAGLARISLIPDRETRAEISVANGIHRISRCDARRGRQIRRSTAAQCKEDRGYDASPRKPNQTPPMQSVHNILPAVAPHCHIYGERLRNLRAGQEKPLLRRAISAFIYNCGHSANIVRPTQQSMRQTNDYFGQIITFSVRDAISAT